MLSFQRLTVPLGVDFFKGHYNEHKIHLIATRSSTGINFARALMRDRPRAPGRSCGTPWNPDGRRTRIKQPTAWAAVLSTALSLALCGAAAHAAPIVWNAATNISGDSDVSTDGTLVNAVNLGAAGVAATTVNGVLFNPLLMTGTSVLSGNFTFAIPIGFSAFNGAGAPNPPFSTLSAPIKRSSRQSPSTLPLRSRSR